MFKSEINWTNKSVRAFAVGDDPIDKIVKVTKEIILKSSDSGIEGPPFDPFKLAQYMGVEIIPRHDVSDARIIPVSERKFRIEYNTNKPKSRIRFSIAHELVHTLFPDCAKGIRSRENKKNVGKDSWQLEMLCNIGASELLMPIGSFPDLGRAEISIGNLLELRKRYDVSSEALFLRAAKLTKAPCFVFCASRVNPDDNKSVYALDYIVHSKSWNLDLPRKLALPSDSIISKCTAVGYKLISDEKWRKELGKFHVECVGITPYPSHRYPRVLGIVTKSKIKKRRVNKINYKFGDASEPTTKGPFIVAHVVNDKALRWGGQGFAKYLKLKWPSVENSFIKFKQKFPNQFKLGGIHKFNLGNKSQVISMIAQKGYGLSDSPRIRYDALKHCLQKVAKEALLNSSSVHMPRIGCGQAGGSWDIVSELIEDELCDLGVKVNIYDLPSK